MAAESTAERGSATTGVRFVRQLDPRAGMSLAALWLIAGALAVRQAAAVLRLPPEERLPDLLSWLGDNGVLRVRDSLYGGDSSFTGTPLAGLVLKPLTRAAEQGLGIAWTLGTMVLVVALAAVAARALPGPLTSRARLFAVPVALCLLAVSIPVRNTFHLGQISILPVLLVLIGWLTAERNPRTAGVLIGLAAAFQPAVLLFAGLLWLTGRRSAALTSLGAFAASTALAWVVLPDDSWTYWIHHLAGVGLGEPADSLANQSLHGALLRAGLRGPVEIVLLAVLVAGVCWWALRRATRYAADGQLLLAAAVTGCAVVAASPTAWQHQLLWVLLALVGRVGRRTGDRWMWPVFVVLVMSLDSEALVPKIAVLGPLGENAPLFAALLAACAIPFLTRSSPTWDAPERSGPLSRPNLMLELLLIRVGYWAYSYVRGHAPDGRGRAEGHGDQILSLESMLHIDMEYTLNHFAASVSWLEEACNYYYTTFHFLVPLSLLAWLYLRRPAAYRSTRMALSFATLLALVGFYFYPLAPPRLMPGLGYIDTAHGPQDLTDPDFGALTEISNQYAAMPSLHVGWSLWCAVVIFLVSSKLWIRLLGALYPLLTTYVVMATANHYLLDAVGGALVVALGFGLQRLIFHIRERRSAEGAVGDEAATRSAAEERSGTEEEPAHAVAAPSSTASMSSTGSPSSPARDTPSSAEAPKAAGEPAVSGTASTPDGPDEQHTPAPSASEHPPKAAKASEAAGTGDQPAVEGEASGTDSRPGSPSGEEAEPAEGDSRAGAEPPRVPRQSTGSPEPAAPTPQE